MQEKGWSMNRLISRSSHRELFKKEFFWIGGVSDVVVVVGLRSRGALLEEQN
jgi:hypothetical protein